MRDESRPQAAPGSPTKRINDNGSTDVPVLRGYADAAEDYLTLGYTPLPIPFGEKSPPPEGTTGYRGSVSREQVTDWTTTRAGANLALRLPPDLVGLDVDVYHGGDAGLAELEAKFGPLPNTVHSTSRVDGSGIKLFRVPKGTRLDKNPAAGVDTIQSHHRYTICNPSLHPEGNVYRWIDEASGEVVDLPPEPGEITELPWRWIEGLRTVSGGTKAEHAATPDQMAEFVDTHTEARKPEGLHGLHTVLTQRRAAGKSRHDTLLEVACWGLRESGAGYYAAADVLELLEGVVGRGHGRSTPTRR